MRNKTSLLMLALLGLLTFACKKDNNPNDLNTERQFELYFNYHNDDGISPVVSLDSTFPTSADIVIDTNAIVAQVMGANQVDVVFNNVSIIKDEIHSDIIYEIQDIHADILRDGQWFTDSEFEYDYSPLVDLDLIINLDASNSLENDFPQIQGYVKSFIDNVFEDIPNVNIGIVDFSTNVNTFPIIDNQAILNGYIDSISLGQFTALYRAMERGLEMLRETDAQSKAMLTFTDGNDNQSNAALTPDSLSNMMVNSGDASRVASFMIGLGDGINKTALEKLAVNGGLASFPTTIEELGDVFGNFSSTISTVHSLSYKRNQQVIPATDPVSIRFVITAKAK